ncbi:hypothetical protein Dimus_035915 [Dionaea muscipula]
MTKELSDAKADVNMLKWDMDNLDNRNSDLIKRNEELTSELKIVTEECDRLSLQNRTMEGETQRLRSGNWTMKKERDEAQTMAHQFAKTITDEGHKRCALEKQIEKLTNENAALRVAQKGLEDARIKEIKMADGEWARAEVFQKIVEGMENRQTNIGKPFTSTTGVHKMSGHQGVLGFRGFW